MAIIKTLRNRLKKQIIYPVTKTKAIYDDDGNRLDNILIEITNSTTNEVITGLVAYKCANTVMLNPTDPILYSELKKADLSAALLPITDIKVPAIVYEITSKDPYIGLVNISTAGKITLFGDLYNNTPTNYYVQFLATYISAT